MIWITCDMYSTTVIQSFERRGIVVMNFDCYTGDRSSIPTHGNSLGK